MISSFRRKYDNERVQVASLCNKNNESLLTGEVAIIMI